MDKRAYNITNSEISAIFWGIKLVLIIFVILNLMNMMAQVQIGNPGLAMTFMFLISIICIAEFFGFISMALPNYMISKYNLNIWVDKLTSPDHIGWFRATRNKNLRNYTVPTGALGQTKGMANGQKADVINDGKYTMTLPNGNRVILTNDFLSSNANLDNVTGWQLIKRHYGLVGFEIWDKAVETKNLLIDVGDNDDEKTKK